jgi:DNA-binding NtrC family response regulator
MTDLNSRPQDVPAEALNRDRKATVAIRRQCPKGLMWHVKGRTGPTNWQLTCMSRDMPIRVLVIDDDEEIRTAICDCLRAKGFITDGASEREEAESLLANLSYDLMITDLALTRVGCQGIDLLNFAAGLERPPRAIVLTGLADSSHREEAITSGASAFLAKPVPLSVLIEVVMHMAGNLANTSPEPGSLSPETQENPR